MGRAAPRQAGALQVAESSCSEVCAALLVATARGTRRRVRACARRGTHPRQIERYLLRDCVSVPLVPAVSWWCAALWFLARAQSLVPL